MKLLQFKFLGVEWDFRFFVIMIWFFVAMFSLGYGVIGIIPISLGDKWAIPLYIADLVVIALTMSSQKHVFNIMNDII